MSQLNFSPRDYLDRCFKNTLTCLSLHQSVCDVPPSCFTRSDDLYYLEKFKNKAQTSFSLANCLQSSLTFSLNMRCLFCVFA